MVFLTLISESFFIIYELSSISLKRKDTKANITLYLLWARQDSNLRPSGYEPRALPLSYGPGFS